MEKMKKSVWSCIENVEDLIEGISDIRKNSWEELEEGVKELLISIREKREEVK